MAKKPVTKTFAFQKEFEFELNQEVEIAASRERGEVIGRAEFATSENSYLIRYAAHDGRAVEQWWAESALKEV